MATPRPLTGSPFAVIVALLVGGCDDEPTLVILQNQMTGIGVADCVVPQQRESDFRGLGTLDVGLDKPYPYILYPLVTNAASDPIAIDGARVKVIPPALKGHAWDSQCPLAFDSPFATTVEPKGDRVLIVEALPACFAKQILDLMIDGTLSPSLDDHIFTKVEVRVTGTDPRGKVESGAFTYPVRICYGCLQTGVPAPYASFPEVEPCADLAARGKNEHRGNPCNIAQDVGPVVCCAVDASTLTCPAP